MFFHTHVYYAKRVDENLDSLKIVGSFLPDLALTGLISWQALHKKKNILAFFAFLEKHNPEYTSLIKGITYHNTLDYYTHVAYNNTTPGYAYAIIPTEMPSLLERALGVDSERAKTSSHNFIESGVEYYLLHDEPDLAKLVKRSIGEINKEKLADVFAAFYEKDTRDMLEALNKLFYFATNYDLSKLDDWITFWKDLNKFYLKNDTDLERTRIALELSLKRTKSSYKEFITYAISSQDREIKDAN